VKSWYTCDSQRASSASISSRTSTTRLGPALGRLRADLPGVRAGGGALCSAAHSCWKVAGGAGAAAAAAAAAGAAAPGVGLQGVQAAAGCCCPSARLLEMSPRGSGVCCVGLRPVPARGVAAAAPAAPCLPRVEGGGVRAAAAAGVPSTPRGVASTAAAAAAAAPAAAAAGVAGRARALLWLGSLYAAMMVPYSCDASEPDMQLTERTSGAASPCSAQHSWTARVMVCVLPVPGRPLT
jgi:large subunit ribosomal protein L22e